MALSELLICNMALSRIGVGYQLTIGAGTIASSTDTGAELRACSLWYERCRNRLLEQIPWTFARKYATLTLNDDGTGEIWEDEWDNAYTYPSDCLTARRFVNDSTWASTEGWWGDVYRRVYASPYSEWAFVVRIHGSTKVIMTNVAEADANLEYTYAVTTATLFTEQFADLLAWTLAAEIAEPLAINTARSDRARQMAQISFQRAAAHVLNEEIRYPQGDTSFVTAMF